MRTYPRITKEGNDPDCIHREGIVNQVGTCVICHQVREYAPAWLTDTRPESQKRASQRGAKPGVPKASKENSPRHTNGRGETEQCSAAAGIKRKPGRPMGSKDREVKV